MVFLKATRTASITTGGKIGVTTYYDHADFGYTAFSNKVNGSGVFSLYKTGTGTIPAVHYNEGGEGVGYHDLAVGIAVVHTATIMWIYGTVKEGGHTEHWLE